MNDLNIGQEYLWHLTGLPRRRTWHEDAYLAPIEQEQSSEQARELVWTGIAIGIVGILCGGFWVLILWPR